MQPKELKFIKVSALKLQMMSIVGHETNLEISKYFDAGIFFRWKSIGSGTISLHEMQNAMGIEFENHKIGINKRNFINFCRLVA